MDRAIESGMQRPAWEMERWRTRVIQVPQRAPALTELAAQWSEVNSFHSMRCGRFRRRQVGVSQSENFGVFEALI
jgi:hypothetical protein